MFCRNCGAQLSSDSQFCPKCGAKVENTNSSNNTEIKNDNNFNNNNQNQPPVSNQTNTTTDNTKVIRVVSYLGILFLVGLFCNQKNDPNVRFHTGQGMILFITDIVIYFAISILSSIFWQIGALLSPLLAIFILVLEVIGIINAVKNENKPLPLIGTLAFYK